MSDSNGTILLTGGTGFLGSHLRPELRASGRQVQLLVRSGDSVRPADNEEVVEGDVTRPETLPTDGYDVVIHLAARTDVEDGLENPRQTWDVNATGTINVLEAARAADVSRFLYASTASIYGVPRYLPIDEVHPQNPREPYGLSKLAGDRATWTYYSAYDVSTVVVRFFNVFGPGQPEHNVVPAIVSQALNSDVVELGNLHPSRDFVYVDDAIDGLLRVLADGTPGEAYNVGRGEDVEVGTLAETIVEEIDSGVEIRSVPERQREEGVEIAEHVADVSKLKSLGWRPEHHLRAGIRKTVDRFE